MRAVHNPYVVALVLAVASVLFLVLAIGALGIVGEGGQPDRLYAGVLAVGLVGTVAARLRARGMAWTMAAMAVTQGLVTVLAAALVIGGVDDFAGASVVDLIGINAMYVALFGASAWLFRRAAMATSTRDVYSR